MISISLYSVSRNIIWFKPRNSSTNCDIFRRNFSQKSREMLLGKDYTAEKAFDHFDEDKDVEAD